jgi:ParB/RepB/Spo0J family partition protein
MDTITQIPLEQLLESPFNPRKTFTGVDELADNIRAEGRIHQPLLVRPITPNPLRDDIITGYEVVFGHRRLRAAEAAGLATVPCMVRALTDAEARSAQIAENLARADVHPIEEAEGFAVMIEQDGITAEALATKVGKSLSYVYARLKLLQACAEIRTACLAGQIGSEVALLIARLRTDKLQQKALAAIRNDTSTSAKLDDGGKRSFRHIRDLLAERFTLDLKAAIFDREDATLLPPAGVCSACPKRTGNAPEYADLVAKERPGEHGGHYMRTGGANLCTDPDCFDAKKTAHLQRAAEAHVAKGAIVVTGNKARAAIGADGKVKGDYIALDDVKRALKSKAGAAKASELPVVLIQDPRTGNTVRACKRFDLVAKGLADKATPADTGAAQRERAEAHRAKIAKKVEIEAARRMGLLQHVRDQAVGRELGTFELRMVVAAALQGVQWKDRETLVQLHGLDNTHQGTRALQGKIDTLDAAGLTRLLLDCLLVDGVRCSDEWSLDRKPGPLLALAQHYGVDAEAVMRASEPPPVTPPQGTSAPSTAGAGAKQGKAAPAKKAARPLMAFHCPATGMTWSGRGLQPAWIKAALAQGKTLDSLRVAPDLKKAKPKAGAAGGAAQLDPAELDAQVA